MGMKAQLNRTQDNIERALAGWKGVVLVAGLLVAIGVLGLFWWLNRGDWVYPEQINSTQRLSSVLSKGYTIDQTFVAKQDGLQGIKILVEAPAQNLQPYTVTLQLLAQDETTILRQASTIVSSPKAHQWVSLPFEPISNSRAAYYSAKIIAQGVEPDSSIATGDSSSYLDGSLSINDIFQNRQMVFQLTYNRREMVVGTAKRFLTAFPEILLALGIFFIPGWALIELLKLPVVITWGEKIAISFGTTVALYPTIYLYMYLLKVQPGVKLVWLLLIGGVIILIWHYRPWRKKLWTDLHSIWDDISFSKTVFGTTLILLMVVVAITRASAIQYVDVPLWDDSVQHAVITQRILETGGLFQSWEPYAPYKTFSLHFGFHINMAVLAWVTHLPVQKAILWGGQFFNVLAVLGLYALAVRLWGRWAGLIAILAAGMLAQFPAYYVNWGRYPQLTGQLILPVAAWWLWVLLGLIKCRNDYLKIILVAALVVSGMVFAYYRMIFHFVTFALVVIGVNYFAPNQRNIRKIFSGPIVLLGVGIIAGLVTIPWLRIVASRSQIEPVFSGNYIFQNRSILQQLQQTKYDWSLTEVLGTLAGTIGLFLWGEYLAIPMLWLWSLLALPALTVFPLPGVGIIQSFTIETSLYIPFVLMWGSIGNQALELVRKRIPFFEWLVASLVVLIALVFIPTQSSILDRSKFDLAGRPDILAAEWISHNVPADALILINGITYTDGHSVVGGDGGWWLPILSEREVVIPPQYALVIETPNQLSYSEAVNTLVHALLTEPISSIYAKKAICTFPRPITHLYIGQRQGLVSGALPIPPEKSMLNPEQLLNDTDFSLLYQRDNTWLFEFNRAVCNK